jgi:hypothetical protein
MLVAVIVVRFPHTHTIVGEVGIAQIRILRVPLSSSGGSDPMVMLGSVPVPHMRRVIALYALWRAKRGCGLQT